MKKPMRVPELKQLEQSQYLQKSHFQINRGGGVL